MSKACWKIIRSQEEYDFAMERFLQLAESNLDEDNDLLDEFDLLSLLIGDYESKAFPMDKPSAIEAIKFRMDQQGLSQADMRQYIGSASKVSEVLNAKRPLSLSMIRRLHDGLGIPLEILLQVDERFSSKNKDVIEWEILGSELIDSIEANTAEESIIYTNNFKSLSQKKHMLDINHIIRPARKDDPFKSAMQDGLEWAAGITVEVSARMNAAVAQYNDEDFIRVVH